MELVVDKIAGMSMELNVESSELACAAGVPGWALLRYLSAPGVCWTHCWVSATAVNVSRSWPASEASEAIWLA